jgi:hypothetical protein
MRKLLIGAALCSLFAVPGFAGEPTKLTSAEMDKVAAGNPCSQFITKFSSATCVQKIDVDQTAVAVGGGKFSSTVAANSSDADQVMGDFNIQEVGGQ